MAGQEAPFSIRPFCEMLTPLVRVEPCDLNHIPEATRLDGVAT